jgi:diguanylate cyclase (GGDEF)-like protein/PAS domain S-box-containing protein
MSILTSPNIRILQIAIVTSAFCYILTELGIQLSTPPEYIAIYWPANAVVLAALLFTDRRFWWVFILLMMPANIIPSLRAEYSVEVAITYYFANCTEILIAALAIKFTLGDHIKFDRLREIVMFLFWAVFIAPLSSALIAATTTFFQPEVQYWSVLRIWFFADALGNLTLTPVIILWVSIGIERVKEISSAHLFEACALLLCLITVGFLMLGNEIRVTDHFPALLYTPIPLLLWAALRFGPLGIFTAVLIITLLTIWNAVNGHGPFVSSTSIDNALSLQLFLFAFSIPMMLISALFSERKHVEKELYQSKNRYQTLTESTAAIIWTTDESGGFVEPQASWEKFTGQSWDEYKDYGWTNVIHPEDVDMLLAGWKKACQEITSYETFGRIWNANKKQWRNFEVKATPILNPDDSLNEWVGFILDVTESKQAQTALQESKRQMTTLISNLPGMVYRCNNDQYWTVEFTNDGCLPLTGYTPKEFIDNKNIAYSKLIHPEDTQMVWDGVQEGINNHRPYQITYRIMTRDGKLKSVWEQGRGVFDENNEIIALEGFITDITELKQAEEELLKLSRAVEYSPSAVYITDLDGNIEYINPKFTEITGYSSEEVIGENPRILNSGEIPEEIYTDMWETITSGKDWKGEFRNRKKDGSLYWARNAISCVKNREGKVTHYIALQEDATHEYELSEQLSFQASHDTLTRLINRREFERRAERLVSSVKQDISEHALCYMDLDQFKVVNDTCGHAAGDEMLRQLSTVLMNSVRHRDTLARLGGDEFGVLMEHCSLDDAHRVATTLLKVIQDYQFSWEGHTFKVGVSMGLVPITPTTTNLSELIRDADSACYMAKDKGRNRIHVYHAEDSEIAKRHGEMQWVERIYNALENDQFCLYAQTIAPLDNSTDVHYELLVRMIENTGVIVPPNAFLPAAERYNLISKIDHWVIEKTFSLFKENPEFLNKINFCSINLSGQSLTDSNILDLIISQLENSGIESKKICFEITETAAISNLNSAMKFIAILKDLDCQFALDDFGSGLSSFAYLKNLPVDYLKIDGMFVKDIADDPIDHAMVKSINEIGHVMGMKTIAEFVENDMIKGMLKEIGVNYAQGYGVGKPEPINILLEN